MKAFSINPNSCKKSTYKFTNNFGSKKEESNNKFRRCCFRQKYKNNSNDKKSFY